MPTTFLRLRARYARNASVRCLNVISARACAKGEGAVEFWGLDTSNATGLWGSQHADARCVVGDTDVGWATEISSLSRSYISSQLNAIAKPQPRACARCAERLGRRMDASCTHGIKHALRSVRVPCIDWARELSGESVVHLLLVDAEGHDHEVLEHYPFERVETWRVIFEAARISRSTFAEAAARLRHAGFRHINGGHHMAPCTRYGTTSTRRNRYGTGCIGRDVTPLRLRVARAPTATLGDVCNGPLRRVRVGEEGVEAVEAGHRKNTTLRCEQRVSALNSA